MYSLTFLSMNHEQGVREKGDMVNHEGVREEGDMVDHEGGVLPR